MTRPAATPSDVGADPTAAALDVLARWAVRRDGPRGLSLTALGTLATLERGGPMRLSTLAAREGVAQPSMTTLVSRLEREGLAVRGPDPDDGRAVRVALTDTGRDALTERRALRARRFAELLDRLDPSDRDALASATPALQRLAGLAALAGLAEVGTGSDLREGQHR